MKNSKLTKYLSVAGATVLTAATANADVVYVDFNPDTTLGAGYNTFNLDLNNDAVDDIRFTDGMSFYGSGGTWFPWASIGIAIPGCTSGSARQWSSGLSYSQAVTPLGSNNIVKSPIASSSVISSANPWAAGAYNILSDGFLSNFSSYRCNLPFYSLNSFGGNIFMGPFNVWGQEILSVKFKIGANFHYGWIRLSTYYTHLTIHDYAYNDVPNQPILAGQFGTGPHYVTGNVFDDQNRNGVQDGGEVGKSGVQVQIGAYNAITDGSGNYSITVADSGNYTINVIEPINIYCSGLDTLADSVSYPGTQSYAIYVDSAITNFPNNDFGLAPPIIDCGKEITGLVYQDNNRNGTNDAGDVARSGVRVDLSNGAYAYSNAAGAYKVYTKDTGTFNLVVDPPFTYHCGGVVNDSISEPATGSYAIMVDNISSLYPNNDFGTIEPVNTCGTICGNVWDDVNGNGVQDAGDIGEPGVSVFANGKVTMTDNNGDYCLTVPLNTPITLSVESRASYYACSSSANAEWITTSPASPGTYSITLTAASPTSNGNDFGIDLPMVDYDVSMVSVRTNYGNVAGDCFHAGMDYKAYGTITDTCKLTLYFDSTAITHTSSSTTPDLDENGYIQWIYPPGTAPTMNCMSMWFCVDSTSNVGDTLDWYATYYCGVDSIDKCPSNNTMGREVIINSTKANAIANTMNVYHPSGVEEGKIQYADSTFSYVINFQNLGGDSVHHMYIVDTLPAEFDVSTISRPFSNPHHTDFYVTDENVMVIEFDGIDLPGSDSSEIASYGFVQYNVVLKQDLPIGTTIENTAHITMNYDRTYATNTVVNVIDNNVGIKEELQLNGVVVYPNPTKDWLFVELETRGFNVQVLDIQGREVLLKQTNERSTSLDMNALPKGMYTVKIVQGEQISVKKIIVQ